MYSYDGTHELHPYTKGERQKFDGRALDCYFLKPGSCFQFPSGRATRARSLCFIWPFDLGKKRNPDEKRSKAGIKKQKAKRNTLGLLAVRMCKTRLKWILRPRIPLSFSDPENSSLKPVTMAITRSS